MVFRDRIDYAQFRPLHVCWEFLSVHVAGSSELGKLLAVSLAAISLSNTSDLY